MNEKSLAEEWRELKKREEELKLMRKIQAEKVKIGKLAEELHPTAKTKIKKFLATTTNLLAKLGQKEVELMKRFAQAERERRRLEKMT